MDQPVSAFSHSQPQGNQAQRYTDLQRAFDFIEAAINQRVPPGREKSLALTNLEQAAMWANKGVSRGDADFNA